ncbi:MAG: DnaB-like helicase C-terminal domain-containing protein, partial [Clostridia bacterium]|nr:DnaB-like helicase C-terminal domain-containing protein [Clostridia bacterium]
KKVDLVVVDYLGHMKGSGRADNRTNEVAEITRGLKLMAKDLKIPVIVCAQLNRGTEGKGQKEGAHKPALADLRESGSIEQDADVVLFIYRKKYYDQAGEESTVDEHDMELIVAKNRHGETGTIKLYWDGQYTRFTSVARNEQ